MAIVHIGIDLAKNVFAVYGVDAAGKSFLVRPAVPRAGLHEFIASMPPRTWPQRPALTHITGRVFSPPTATRCG